MSYSYIALLIVLLLASVSDIRTMEVPLFYWILPVFIKIIEKQIKMENILLSVSILICFMFFSFLSNFGGADALLIGTIVFVMGFYGIYAVLLAFVFALPYTLYLKIKDNEKPYPFVPFLFAGAFIVMGLQIL